MAESIDQPKKAPLRVVRPAFVMPKMLQEAGITGFARSREVLAQGISWVWDRCIASTHAVEVVGASGNGKTTFATLYACARANPTGAPVTLLGHVVTPIGDGQQVLAVLEENGGVSSVSQMDRAMSVLGLPVEETWARIFLLSRKNVRAHWPADGELRNPTTLWAAIMACAVEGQWGAVILDTRAKVFAGFGESNAEGAQADASTLITRFVDTGKCEVMVLSHPTKANEQSGPNMVAGSMQRGAGADVILSVTAEKEDKRVTASTVSVVKNRDDDGGEWPADMSFTLSLHDGAWQLSEGPAEASKLPTGDRVHALLRAERKKGVTLETVRKKLKMNGKRAYAVLEALVTEGRAKSRREKVDGRERTLYFWDAPFSELCPTAPGGGGSDE